VPAGSVESESHSHSDGGSTSQPLSSLVPRLLLVSDHSGMPAQALVYRKRPLAFLPPSNSCYKQLGGHSSRNVLLT
jgi:hypothetical protein